MIPYGKTVHKKLGMCRIIRISYFDKTIQLADSDDNTFWCRLADVELGKHRIFDMDGFL